MNDSPRPPTTTDAGIPVASDEHSLTIGPDGPLLLHDHYLIEQMANFNRERIPERQPHAKGSGAFGYFEVTNDVSTYTRAAVFQPGTRTDTLIRFSSVAGERVSYRTCSLAAGMIDITIGPRPSRRQRRTRSSTMVDRADVRSLALAPTALHQLATPGASASEPFLTCDRGR